MDCKEIIVDVRIPHPEEFEKGKLVMQKVFMLNHTLPYSEKYYKVLKDIFGENLGEDSVVNAPIQGACIDRIKIGKNVFINSNTLFMARGGIIIEDDVKIAANCQLLTNNHDSYERKILTCKPILIKKGAWIGAGATIMPGICIGKYAIVGASSVVTHDVPDYSVVVGNPARVIKELDKNKFEEEQ
ncbi:DapH/DapD/GlmU-related protein [Parvimonas micra]|uniref:acyltransferase n=1 Tax=Parvimonas micra TaxID=33033 RepID=UPI0028DB285A|nr:DapH/DapD/GlmU-related protein [Parvimonas micra]